MNKLEKLKSEIELSEVNWAEIKLQNYKKFITSSIFIYPSGKDAFGYCGGFLFFELDKCNFDSLYGMLKQKSIKMSNIRDTSNLYITNNADKHSKSDITLPVPSINHIYSPLVESNYSFSENSQFIVTGFQKGTFLDEKYINAGNNLRNLVIDYNGYSLGALVDEEQQLIILWVMVW
ncbi:hypothetical protein [Marinifilum caeruleilacunae]|uniref:Uncharacterized protein n=1 Tax=Marinifilum caeruleilacunae TaxID=2499076 RepID=A0ABX1X1W5_9BACT|nr:hypothetical protein [Marinifilum caeruleilacunae]NOU62365.1 hypothetical protein [Marinifilum caeruleilacunae]